MRDTYRYVGKKRKDGPENPRGEDYCRAPVIGGCDGFIAPGKRGGCLCEAHEKRRERGQPIDQPIQRRTR